MESIFGIHEQALMLRSRRAEMIANNLANADTPGFKAQDMDFRAALAQATATGAMHDESLSRFHPHHLGGFDGPGMSPMAKYRVSLQPSLDGNTVDSHVEKAQYMSNALYMQATLRFLDDRISGLKSAFRGD